jgi:hypothetical protein
LIEKKQNTSFLTQTSSNRFTAVTWENFTQLGTFLCPLFSPLLISTLQRLWAAGLSLPSRSALQSLNRVYAQKGVYGFVYGFIRLRP